MYKLALAAVLTIGTSQAVAADNGCPGDNLIGVHTAPNTAWTITIRNGGTVTIDRIGADGRASGDATLICAGETVIAKFRNMSNGLKYDCIGELDGVKLRNNMVCTSPETGTLIGHIRASDAYFE